MIPISELELVHQSFSSLICPICQEIFSHASSTFPCFHTFCASCLIQSLELEYICPLCRTKVDTFQPNISIDGVIRELLVYCPNKKFGCSAEIKYDEISQHLCQCTSFPVICEMKSFGCNFRGTLGDSASHKENCIYLKLKPFISQQEDKFKSMEQLILKQQRELERLREFVRTSKTDPSILDNDHSGETEQNFKTTNDHAWPNGPIRCTRTFKESESGVTSIACNNQKLILANYNGNVFCVNIETGLKEFQLKAHQSTVWSLAYDAQKSIIYSGSSDTTIKIWKIQGQSATFQKELTDHSGKIYGLQLYGNKLYSCSSDKTIKAFEILNDDYVVTNTFLGHESNVNSIMFLEDKLVSCSSDKTVKMWDKETAREILSWRSDSSEILDITHSNNMIFASSYNASIHCIDPRSGSLIRTLIGHNWEIWQVEAVNDVLFSGSFDHNIRRWDIRTFECTSVLKEHRGYIHALKVDNTRMISGCADKTVKIWSTSD